MPERVVLVLAVAALVVIGVAVVRALNSGKTRRVMDRKPAWSALGVQPDGRRTLIAFSTPSCAACHKAQAPAIEIAQQRVGAEAIRVIPIDAAQQPDVAKAFGVMTVPSTVIVGAAGQVVAINQGFASSTRLVEQLQRA
jgi:thiol-disulfide isomerase/thioredoxin